MVLGCSTSEVLGKKIGSAGSKEVAGAILERHTGGPRRYRGSPCSAMLRTPQPVPRG